jgi:NADH-quinone oxidoreductase subunit L
MLSILLILLGPMLAITAILLTRRFAAVWAVIGTGLSLSGSIAGTITVAGNKTIVLQLPGLPDMPLRLGLSTQTAVFSLVVAIISLVVTVYATGYMSGDVDKKRFFATFLGFITAMQAFVLAGDMLLLLVAWELMTVASYLLIGYKRADSNSQSAAMRAFLTVRVGDIALYLAAFIYIANAGTTNLAAMSRVSGGPALAIGFLLLAAALVKAGQIPFGGWLRGAMAGPTPVSALLHSATMVAAGAILLIRFLSMLPPGARLAVGLVGAITTMLAGLFAVAQNDLKRLLAASTSSQIGLMFIGVGAGSAVAATLHFTAHAFMKSTLFMGAGIFQHDRGATGFDKLAGVGRQRPFVFALFGIAAVALAGIPPLAGFWSKDAIAAASGSSGKAWLVTAVIIGTFMTGWYMASALRQLYQGAGRKLEKSAGVAVMAGSLLPLTVIILGFGLLTTPLRKYLAIEEVTNLGLATLDVLAAVAGLAAGLYGHMPIQLGNRLQILMQKNYLERYTARPVLSVTVSIARLETNLTSGVYAFGSISVKTAEAVQRHVELPLTERYFSAGRSLQVSARSIGRSLQAGLVHRELALSFGGMAVGFIIIGIIIIVGGK